MKSQTLIGLGAAAVIALAAVVALRPSGAPEAPPKPETLFPGLIERANQASRIEIEAKDGKIALERGADDRWVLPDKGGYPAKFEPVKRAILGLAEARSIEPRTANPELHARIALEDRGAKDAASTLVTLKGQDGAVLAQLLIGKAERSATETKPGSYFVRKPGQAQTWLASGQLGIESGLTRWVEPKIFEIMRGRIARVVIRHADGETLEIARKEADKDDFVIATALPEGRKPMSDSVANPIGGALDFNPYDDVMPAKDLAFDKPDASAVFTSTDGMIVTVRVVKKDGKTWIHYAAAPDPAKPPEEAVRKEIAEIAAKAGPWAFQAPDYRAENFQKRLDAMLAKEGG